MVLFLHNYVFLRRNSKSEAVKTLIVLVYLNRNSENPLDASGKDFTQGFVYGKNNK